MREAPKVMVVGGGPAGLMAAEVLAAAGAAVTVADQMPSLGRKLLMAGRGGLNLTHGEPLPAFLDRYGAARDRLEPIIAAFPPAALVAWCEALGQPTFVGSSGRIFPRAMKASPLLRAWLARLGSLGVTARTRWAWQGFDGAALRFATPEGARRETPAATVLALGGASWPRLGSDGGWVAALGAPVAPLRPANMGFFATWSAPFREKFAGTPLKRIALTFGDRTVRGEAMVTAWGIEGGAVYALSAPLRDAFASGPVVLSVDLRPDLSAAAVAKRLDRPRAGLSLANFLRKSLGLDPVAIGLVQEARHAGAGENLAALVKALPLPLTGPAPLARAISTAGGVRWDAVDDRLMLRARPGVFLAGEMLDWEAPTGGYLLQACMATGAAAGHGALAWLREAGDAWTA